MQQWTHDSVNQWINESMTQWNSAPTNQCMNDLVSRWISKPHELVTRWIDESAMIQWINDSVSRRFSGSMNPMHEWASESMNQWNSESMNQWLTDSVNHWTNESVAHLNRWMKGWMDGGWMKERTSERTNEWIATSSHEAPLLSATSSLSSHVSGLLLLWAASQLALLQLLQPNSSLRAAVSAASSCNPA